MTGYAVCQSPDQQKLCRVEIRGVNSRFLELQVRMPRQLSALEMKVKNLLQQQLSRGSVTVTVSAEFPEDATRLSCDIGAIDQYIHLVKKIAATHNIRGELDMGSLRGIEAYITAEPVVFDEQQGWQLIEPVLLEALDTFSAMRTKEGQYLQKQLLILLDSIQDRLQQVIKLAPARLDKARQSLQGRLEGLLQGHLEPHRISLEVAALADKLDISEECTRLQAHVASFRQTITAGGQVGKRLNFLLQEMHRETNTISAKANDVALSHISVEMKEQIESMREQIQNIE